MKTKLLLTALLLLGQPAALAVAPDPLDSLPSVEPAPVVPGHVSPPRAKAPPLFSASPGQEVASPFTLRLPTQVRRITWHGLGAEEQEFTVRILDDADGLPKEPARESYTVKVKGKASGVVLQDPGRAADGKELRQYVFELPKEVPLEAGKPLWISVAGHGRPQWMWARGDLRANGLATRNTLNPSPWKKGALGGCTAFTVEGAELKPRAKP